MGQIYDLHSQQYSDGHAGELGKEGWAAGATVLRTGPHAHGTEATRGECSLRVACGHLLLHSREAPSVIC